MKCFCEFSYLHLQTFKLFNDKISAFKQDGDFYYKAEIWKLCK